jgi:glycosyltransferase involved in cell wall biosynthesis
VLDVLVCCHDDAALLPNLLDALTAQTAKDFRVIVVDNASTDDPAAVVDQYRDRLDIELVFEPVLGLNRARNRGYARATSTFVAHIDADTIPDPHWVEAILDVAAHIGCDLFGGPYRPYYPTPKPDWFLDVFMTRDFGPAAKFLDRDHPYGMNMIWRRAVVEELGGFSIGLGLHGRGLRRGDETELVLRARTTLLRFRVYYDPRISVRTAVRPELFSLRYWARRMFAQGRIAREVRGSSAAGLSWPWPLRAVMASGLFVSMLVKDLVWRRGRRLETALFEDALPALFHLGSAYQDCLDVMRSSHKRR